MEKSCDCSVLRLRVVLWIVDAAQNLVVLMQTSSSFYTWVQGHTSTHQTCRHVKTVTLIFTGPYDFGNKQPRPTVRSRFGNLS